MAATGGVGRELSSLVILDVWLLKSSGGGGTDGNGGGSSSALVVEPPLWLRCCMTNIQCESKKNLP